MQPRKYGFPTGRALENLVNTKDWRERRIVARREVTLRQPTRLVGRLSSAGMHADGAADSGIGVNAAAPALLRFA